MFHRGNEPLWEGEWTEIKTVLLLKQAGYEVRLGTPAEDGISKVDLWIRLGEGWIPIQLTTGVRFLRDKMDVAEKYRVVPVAVDSKLLYKAVEGGEGTEFVKKFFAFVSGYIRVKGGDVIVRQPYWA